MGQSGWYGGRAAASGRRRRTLLLIWSDSIHPAVPFLVESFFFLVTEGLFRLFVIYMGLGFLHFIGLLSRLITVDYTDLEFFFFILDGT